MPNPNPTSLNHDGIVGLLSKENDEAAEILKRELEEASQVASPGRVMPPEMTEAGLPFGSITGEGTPDQ